METQGDDFLSGILFDGQDAHVSGLDDLNIPITPEELENVSEDPDVQVVASVGSKVSKRAKNFNSDEDKSVCLAWLDASKDPLHRANQNRARFWGRVHRFFEEENKRGIPRTESSVMHRWLIIQTQVNKFCSCYDAIVRRNPSGTTIDDKIAEATKMFEGLVNKDSKKFNVMPCWQILKHEDKWKSKRKELLQLEKEAAAAAKSGKKRKKQPTKVSQPREPEGSNNAHEEGDDAETTPTKRGDGGIKKGKERLRRGGGEATLEAIDKMWAKKEEADKEKEKAKQERFMAALEISKENLELEKKRVLSEEIKAEAENKRAEADAKRAEAEAKRAEADLIKEEKEIMFADMTSFNPAQREWLDMMQKGILARRRGN